MCVHEHIGVRIDRYIKYTEHALCNVCGKAVVMTILSNMFRCVTNCIYSNLPCKCSLDYLNIGIRSFLFCELMPYFSSVNSSKRQIRNCICIYIF